MLDLWSWQGTIRRGRYLATGVILFVLKHNIDRILAAIAGFPWSPVSYWSFINPQGVASLNPGSHFYRIRFG